METPADVVMTDETGARARALPPERWSPPTMVAPWVLDLGFTQDRPLPQDLEDGDLSATMGRASELSPGSWRNTSDAASNATTVEPSHMLDGTNGAIDASRAAGDLASPSTVDSHVNPPPSMDETDAPAGREVQTTLTAPALAMADPMDVPLPDEDDLVDYDDEEPVV